ncbi:hypothetical protein GYH30_011963 [Glycine max]|uniref:Uncharacterized protein n=1 Tax=Glycine max TaxID=3847 RepID=K7KNX8_SOYBN|nr:hypothetical protein GYH30_011963 [Glycine max]
MGNPVSNRNRSTNSVYNLTTISTSFMGNRGRNDKANEHRSFFAPLNQCHNCIQLH